MAMQGLRSHGNPIVGGPGFQQGPFFPARFVGTLFDYPENDIELLPIFRAAGSVSIITALAFGLFFLIADARYRRQLRTLGEMGAGLPNPTSVDAVADRYLDESKKSPVYAKVVLDYGSRKVSPWLSLKSQVSSLSTALKKKLTDFGQLFGV